ncbi:MAG: GNAT family N-acetyltransferase [Gemmataceae bacterium]
MLIATPEERTADPDALAGFLYGTHLPGYGGYVCYLGVDERFRRRGVGTRLFDQAFKVLAADAGAADEPLPFVVWESRKPGPDATDADGKLWDARVKLFARAGGLWAEGRAAHPELHHPRRPPVRLQVFVKPADVPAAAFDAERVRGWSAGCWSGCTVCSRATRCGPRRCRRGASRGCGRRPRPGGRGGSWWRWGERFLSPSLLRGGGRGMGSSRPADPVVLMPRRRVGGCNPTPNPLPEAGRGSKPATGCVLSPALGW